MKRLLLGLCALLLVVSGVAMVSAYEAHVINVRAKVENATYLTRENIDFGSVFPQEWLIEEFNVQVSDSFCAESQNRTSKIDYSIWVEWKKGLGKTAYWLAANNTWQGPYAGYYDWLGDALYIGIDVVPANKKYPAAAGGNLTPVGAPPPIGGAKWLLNSPKSLSKYDSPPGGYNMGDKITIGLDVPVFEGYYNEATDKAWQYSENMTKPSGLDEPTYIIPDGSQKYTTMPRHPNYNEEGMELGVDLKIQVTEILRVP